MANRENISVSLTPRQAEIVRARALIQVGADQGKPRITPWSSSASVRIVYEPTDDGIRVARLLHDTRNLGAEPARDAGGDA